MIHLASNKSFSYVFTRTHFSESLFILLKTLVSVMHFFFFRRFDPRNFAWSLLFLLATLAYLVDFVFYWSFTPVNFAGSLILLLENLTCFIFFRDLTQMRFLFLNLCLETKLALCPAKSSRYHFIFLLHLANCWRLLFN